MILASIPGTIPVPVTPLAASWSASLAWSLPAPPHASPGPPHCPDPLHFPTPRRKRGHIHPGTDMAFPQLPIGRKVSIKLSKHSGKRGLVLVFLVFSFLPLSFKFSLRCLQPKHSQAGTGMVTNPTGYRAWNAQRTQPQLCQQPRSSAGWDELQKSKGGFGEQNAASPQHLPPAIPQHSSSSTSTGIIFPSIFFSLWGNLSQPLGAVSVFLHLVSIRSVQPR